MTDPGHQNSPYGDDGEPMADDQQSFVPGLWIALALIALCVVAGWLEGR